MDPLTLALIQGGIAAVTPLLARAVSGKPVTGEDIKQDAQDINADELRKLNVLLKMRTRELEDQARAAGITGSGRSDALASIYGQNNELINNSMSNQARRVAEARARARQLDMARKAAMAKGVAELSGGIAEGVSAIYTGDKQDELLEKTIKGQNKALGKVLKAKSKGEAAPPAVSGYDSSVENILNGLPSLQFDIQGLDTSSDALPFLTY